MDTAQQDTSTEVPSLGPFKNVEFPPLSQLPDVGGVMMPASSPVDQTSLEKWTVLPPGQQEEGCYVEKDLIKVLCDTEDMYIYGLRQVRHLNAITLELKLLLEYEQKILEQVMARIDKFKALRDQFKEKSTKWEDNYKSKIPEYDSYTTKLINVHFVENITAEGLPSPVQQKILFQIVSKATNIANRVVVQLSMGEAVANDIDLTLQDVKKYCAVMLKQINSWLRVLKSQACHQGIVIDRWNDIKDNLKDLKAKSEAAVPSQEATSQVDKRLKKYEDRIVRIEKAICKLCGPSCETCCSDDQQSEQSDKQDSTYDSCQQDLSQTVFHTPGGYPSYDPCCDPIRDGSPASPGDPRISPQAPMAASTPFMPDFMLPSPTSPGALFGEQLSPGGGGPVPEGGGELRRCRAPPGAFPDIELIDTPAMGYPVPVAALLRGGRQPGQYVPLSPTSPTPPNMGRFRPLATSTPPQGNTSVLRPRCVPAPPPECPPLEQSQDPAILPKIQNDLQRLADRNRNLQELFSNFKRIRATLTEEIDKAVRLNQKLQRDLYYVAEAHRQ